MSYRPDLLSKTLAGTLLGLTLAMATSALFAWLTPGGPSAINKFQFVMWLVAPVWTLILSAVYFFRNGRRAWVVLTLANLVAFGAYLALRLTASS